MSDLNPWAILLAAVSSFLLGGLWYGPMFKQAWCRLAGVDPDQKPAHQARVFGVAFAMSLLAATAFAWMLGPEPPIAFSLGMGVLVGLGFVATSFGINYQFAGRPALLWAIDGGYHTLQFVLYALILALWH
jgi:predicted membrane metal-binding protein